MRRSSKLALPMKRPDDVIPHLGKVTHWKEGRSAKLLADQWFLADAIPSSVRALLAQCEYLADAELLDGWLERETDLGDGRATPSQTDLLALLGLKKEIAVLGIEAKVDEGFGRVVGDWVEGAGEGKVQRLSGLCTLLGVTPAEARSLRYQLLHRTAAVILEARRFRSDAAILIIQSFCARRTGFDDARGFFSAIGFADLEPGRLLGARRIGGVDLWVGWVHEPLPMNDDVALMKEPA